VAEPSADESVVFEVSPGGRLTGEIGVPGDKSISHRAIMLGALAEGTTAITGFLEGADALATLAAFRAMGVAISGPADGGVTIEGVGLHGLSAPSEALDLGNSGTSMRLLAGLLSGQRFDSTLTGDASLSRRPMGRVTEPLTTMGARIETGEGGTAPLTFRGGQKLVGIDYPMPIASAQVKSCLLLAGLYARGTTRVTEPATTRDHTERMLAGFGYTVKRVGTSAAVSGDGRLYGRDVAVPADISSAAFFLVGAAVTPGSDLLLRHVGLNPTRIGVLHILDQMGAHISVSNQREVGGEPVGDIRVCGSRLQGVRIGADLVALAIDEFPALFIAAAAAEGETLVTGAEELRVKESDRIQVMADGLAALGVTAEPRPDGIRIVGGAIRGGCVAARGDHRVAMAFAMAGLISADGVRVEDCANVDTSFPGFAELARDAGLGIRVQREVL
jgi:3-phosphoshikimate 1-carboxyvinyltransferase